MNIYFLRHGQTETPGTYTGSTDVALSTSGRNQVQTIAPLVRAIEIDACFCSPMLRCRSTFEILDLNSQCIVDDALKEIDFGTWEGKSFTQVYDEDRETMETWFEQKERFSFPSGESIHSFGCRVTRWVEKLRCTSYANVLVVSHAGVIRYAIGRLLNLDQGIADQFEIVEGCLSLVNIADDYGVLKFLNKSG